jgi:methionyl-tRNA synthetase
MHPFAFTQDLFPFLSAVPAGVLFVLFIVLALWTTVIKAFALWHAARNGQTFWFVALLVVNSLGILELVYLLAFRKDRREFKAVASDAPAA